MTPFWGVVLIFQKSRLSLFSTPASPSLPLTGSFYRVPYVSSSPQSPLPDRVEYVYSSVLSDKFLGSEDTDLTNVYFLTATEWFLIAGVAKLVDAPDSKSGSSNGVSVRVRPSVPLASYNQWLTSRGFLGPRNIRPNIKYFDPMSFEVFQTISPTYHWRHPGCLAVCTWCLRLGVRCSPRDVRHETEKWGHRLGFYCQLLNQVINKCLGKVVFAAITLIALRTL